MNDSPTLRHVLTNFDAWSHRLLPTRALRPYQLAPAEDILRSVLGHHGSQFAVVFSRQAGKDEMLAQLISFLLVRFSRQGGQIVVAAPTLRPQAAISQRRLVDCLRMNPLVAPMTTVRGNQVAVGRATVTFASASPQANTRGLTADLLLVANEAQDIAPEVWDAVFDPMAASTNATTLFMGTVWSQHGLLARQMRFLEQREAEDGVKMVWRVPWTEVAAVLPAYGDRVRARIAQFGEHHPFIRTEYCLEQLDGEDGLFPPARLESLEGTHPRLSGPLAGQRYALLVDVGGEERDHVDLVDGGWRQGRRDSTAVTVVEVDPQQRPDQLPVYRVVNRLLWNGLGQPAIHANLVGLVDHWRAEWVVVDGTGLGAGLAAFLEATYRRPVAGARPVKVVPFVFTAASKSRLGWDLIALIEAGRLRNHLPPDPPDETASEFLVQARNTVQEVLPGPGRLMRWYVPANLGHDDLVTSLALVATLDDLDMRPRLARGSG